MERPRDLGSRERRSRGRTLALATKRVVDVVGAAAGLVALAPLLALVALSLLATGGPPVFFRQERPGLGGRIFTIVKFRTMRPLRPGEAPYFTDRERITRLGRFLRSTSIDELPELWNVLRGDMSLVGPRPLLVEYLDKYTPEQRRRHDVLPGITGWAAVNGRPSRRFGDRLALDVWYVDHWSLWLDLKILALTLYQVIRRVDVAAAQDVEEMGFPLESGPDARPEPSSRPAGSATAGSAGGSGDGGGGARAP
jgi:lipopolysaccharide/colanic/teichoic acid biosynthesis glycosyltransferase